MDIEKQFEKFIKEDKIEEAFWKVIVPDMPPVFVEAGSAAEIKASMRKKLKGEAFKELVIDRENYDHFNEEKLTYKAEPGINEEIVRKISKDKNEPEWMLRKRLNGLKLFKAQNN